ncbi:hypothetical protein [Terrisporobacter mayombei]|uniref:Uncharacterized protein n=1 Tax=Terrisporobacter mayombei TaxID=1541 RepID=A0ABY9PXW0_9FIRM|nr:hypothetical protein [Terrisporobacter mayombei]MCC3867925.1 hypothetical protein [Terrisporobacter mayombei]WMT80059.1 hypothetical protein TEMA_03330 [Terrisporobacter mayombei]
MLKEIRIGEKFSYLENDYRLCCMGEGNFETAEKTLQYFLGILEDEEKSRIGFDENDINSVFKAYGKRIIYFYEDMDLYSEERIEFVKEMRAKFPECVIHIVMSSGVECSLHDVHDRCKDIMEFNEELGGEMYLHNVINKNMDEISTKIVVGM